MPDSVYSDDHAEVPRPARLHAGQCVRGKGKFHAIKYTQSAELPDKDYPMLLTTGRVLYQFHTGTMTRKAQCLESVSGTPFVEVNTQDAEQLRRSLRTALTLKVFLVPLQFTPLR